MFSALPVPQFDWNERICGMRSAHFRWWGVICGALWCLCGALPLPDRAAHAAGFCLIPVWVTGGIHLDGYADTCDALASYGDTAKKLAILKDPHCGAFAVIRLCSYFAAYLMLCACVQFTPRTGALWTLALMGERMLSGLAVAAFPLAKKYRAGPHLCNGCGPPNGLPCFWRQAACCGRLGFWPWAAGRFCWRQGWCLHGITGSLSGSLAVRPVIWPGGSCKNASFGCWRHWPPVNGWGCCKCFLSRGRSIAASAHCCAVRRAADL